MLLSAAVNTQDTSQSNRHQLRGNTNASQDISNGPDIKEIEAVVVKDARTSADADEAVSSLTTGYRERVLQNCGRQCSSNAHCRQNGGTCGSCDGSRCYDPGNRSGAVVGVGGYYDLACHSTFGLFQSALNNVNANVITVCQNAVINLSGNSALTTNRDNLTINCNGGTCIIRRTGGTGRLMEFFGSRITLIGITFDGGDAAFDGAGVYIEGSNNRIQNCNFINNRSANGQGGAAYIGGGTVISANGSQNSAPTCNGVYVRNTNECYNLFDNLDYYNGDNGGDRFFGSSGVCFSQQCWTDQNCNGECSECSYDNPANPRCVFPNGNRIGGQCNTFCASNYQCSSKIGVCNSCEFATNRCIDANNRINGAGGGFRTCISNQEGLRIALESSNTEAVEICSNAEIVLTQGITSNVNDKILRCQSNARTCTIRRENGGAAFRLLNFGGNDVQVFDITFIGGKAPTGNGGAIQFTGTDAKVTNCAFSGNQASAGKGGAMAMQTGDMFNNNGSGNYAAQCTDVYVVSRGGCSTLA
jgi:hypothetical protein